MHPGERPGRRRGAHHEHHHHDPPHFRGQAREALEFYRSVFGGRLDAVSYADAHAVTAPEEADQLLWGQLASESGFRVMAYDVPRHTAHDPGTIPVFVSVRGTDADEIRHYWEALVEGSTVVVPLGPSAWSPFYGMLRDRFGVTFVVDLEVAWG
ncbi:Glyoxalase/Bleomycin resistance protein/Dioxygenase superfamily protein [Rathayibacter tanaceti]|uniref:Glyoxalase/Bleomycin resistance protein/Dioxygenase superfamily protein n=1 Tax=Rathayibacter tanaceti TaxID=1671680 RepID=A0A166I853_9MICO|nr:Glyoxalase/Bleomycin resistance protein/Dioxygenase superfamily protein [Rathayibacter tanaceti]